MYFYEIHDGRYDLVDIDRDNEVIHYGGEVIAVAFSYESDRDGISGTLHKHGSPEAVYKWADETKAKLRSVGDPFGIEMADAIVVITGKIPLEDINKMISTTGYVGTWYKKLMEESAILGQTDIIH